MISIICPLLFLKMEKKIMIDDKRDNGKRDNYIDNKFEDEEEIKDKMIGRMKKKLRIK